MANKAIITGVPGWLGTAFLCAMTKGLRDSPELMLPERSSIAVLSHPDAIASNGTIGKDIECVKADLRDVEHIRPLFKEASGATVFHIAGVIHPQGGIKELYQINVEGTRNLLQLAKAAGVRRFIYVSSNSPCGCNPANNDRFDESSPYNPYLNYGRSKMEAEKLVSAAHAVAGMETVIIRPPWFYGPFQPPRQTLFFSMIKDGKVPLVGDGNNKRSMAYVDNICQALLLCESVQSASGNTYWIADADPYSMNEIIDTIESVMETDFKISVKHKRMRLPALASAVAFIVDSSLQSAGLYHQKFHVLSEMDKTIACDVAKAIRDLGYAPKVALREGMKRSIEFILANGGTI